jgi:hypothetical protein
MQLQATRKIVHEQHTPLNVSYLEYGGIFASLASRCVPAPGVTPYARDGNLALCGMYPHFCVPSVPLRPAPVEGLVFA